MKKTIIEKLAKDDGTTLITHSKYVRDVSLILLKEILYEEQYNNYKKIVEISSLLHDIGKLTKNFQNILENKDNENKEKFKYTHNQIGWAFVSKYLNVGKRDKKLIEYSIYWHHGIFNKNDNLNGDILDEILYKDKELMKNYIITILGDEYYNDSELDCIKQPKYYEIDNENNFSDIIKYLIKDCVVLADRIVSSFGKDELKNIDINKEIKKVIERKNISKIVKTKYDNTERFEKQKNIVNKTNKTTIINAPAGFGKTILGLLWSLKNNKKIIWVCPRNMVAESVYDSIIKELKNLNINLSVELFITGEIIKSNIENKEGFNSDIIITNIDNYLYTSIRNDKLIHSYLTNNVNVIFDEYHELVSDSPIFSLFILIMKIRNNLSKSKTLLLSATPIPINHYWEGLGCNKTKVLPTPGNHYSAIHNKKYELNIINQPDNTENTLTIFNSIKESQKYKYSKKIKYLIHSDFQKEYKKTQFKNLMDLYGKDSIRNIPKDSVVGTHIIQASLDISFLVLNESILSPESTLQRIGRCDRWGDYNDVPIINIFKPDNRSESKSIEVLYDRHLNNEWYNLLSKHNNKLLTLDNFYDLYNLFSNNFNREIRRYIAKRYNKSIKNIEDIYPIKIKKKIDSKIISANSNVLRSNGNDFFVIYFEEKSDSGITEPFSYNPYGNIGNEFREDSNILYRMVKDMKKISIFDDRYNYEYLNNKRKNITIDELRKRAVKSDTPYIRYDKIYHVDYGVIDINLLKELK